MQAIRNLLSRLSSAPFVGVLCILPSKGVFSYLQDFFLLFLSILICLFGSTTILKWHLRPEGSTHSSDSLLGLEGGESKRALGSMFLLLFTFFGIGETFWVMLRVHFWSRWSGRRTGKASSCAWEARPAGPPSRYEVKVVLHSWFIYIE